VPAKQSGTTCRPTRTFCNFVSDEDGREYDLRLTTSCCAHLKHVGISVLVRILWICAQTEFSTPSRTSKLEFGFDALLEAVFIGDSMATTALLQVYDCRVAGRCSGAVNSKAYELS